MNTTPNLQRIVDDPRYTVRNLSDAIEEMPNFYGLLGQLGVFPGRGIEASFVEIERRKRQLNILPTSERGGPASKGRASSRDKIIIPMLYYSHEDQLLAAELQNLPAFGTESFYEQFDEKLFEKMEDIARKFHQTYEYLKWGALRGQVFDADGVTELYNLYDLMGEEQRSVDFKLGTTDSDEPLQASKEVRRYMEDELLGETMTTTLALCSPGFMDKMTANEQIRDIYKRQQDTGQKLNPVFDDVYSGFRHGLTTYIEHSGRVSYIDPDTAEETVHQFIPDNECIIIPLGTQQTFRSYYGPGTTVGTVNRPGRAIFPHMKALDHDRGVELWYESAPLFVVQKPRLVIRGYSSN